MIWGADFWIMRRRIRMLMKSESIAHESSLFIIRECLHLTVIE